MISISPCSSCRGYREFVAPGLLLLALPGLVAAQRQPVLRQIKVPHSYYYREMYLPQASSGPSSVTWSPDGKELIYSMQGSLWRQRVGSREARQLTAEPGYDYQPDWSPNGRYVAYVSYRNDAMELRLLDLSSGETRPLISDSTVNVDPRWSPDGGRLAFVSTAHQGRWHIFVASVNADGRLGSVERLTEDRDSGLPRYYYGVHDQHRRWLAALKAGRSFATNGPLLGFTLGGKGLGDEVALPAGGNDLLARVTLQSFVPIDHLEIVRNGEVVAEIPLSGERATVSKTLRVPARESGWYILRARGDRPAYPVLDIHPYATTSPIYVTVGGQPIRSRADAEYFLAWIDRLESAALAHRDWNTEQEKASALATIRQGRAEFEVRRHP